MLNTEHSCNISQTNCCWFADLMNMLLHNLQGTVLSQSSTKKTLHIWPLHYVQPHSWPSPLPLSEIKASICSDKCSCSPLSSYLSFSSELFLSLQASNLPPSSFPSVFIRLGLSTRWLFLSDWRRKSRYTNKMGKVESDECSSLQWPALSVPSSGL